MPYFVYIIYSEKFDTFYKGQTNDINKRIARHNKGLEKSTARYRPWKLLWYTEKPSRSEALSLEKKLKN
uniref:GIY-YIG nuclease family protein n=1 Tax=Winogradskyella sp. TaxID=1883156 RepID=UPI0026016522